MTTKLLSFDFDKPLTFKEHIFWSDFFNNFPSSSNIYLQSWIRKYSDLKVLIADFEKIKFSQSYNSLKESTNYDYFLKAIKSYERIFPEGKKENHFLMCIYGLTCQEWDLEITKDCVFIPRTPSFEQKNWNKSTVPVTLAMVSDLMAGRINHIYPSLKDVNPVGLKGEVKLPIPDDFLLLKVEGSTAKRYLFKGDNYNYGFFDLDFEYSFARNGEDNIFLSPFGKQQKNFLSVLHHQKIEDILGPKNTTGLKVKI